MRSTVKETVHEPALLAMTPRFSVLPRQPLLRQLNIRRQCISTEKVPNNVKSLSDRLTQPLDRMKLIAGSYKEAASLQVEAFWKRNTMIFVGVAGVLACYLLWRLMFGIANVFVGFSEGMAKFGFLAMAAATVAFTGMILKARFTINPDRVYSIAMRKLNMSAAALEVLGAPLTGTDMRAYVMSSGGFRLKRFKPKIGGKRCFLIFPIQGSERQGLVSAEVKKRKGQYDFKLLAIDVANPGADQRLYIVGDEVEYRVGGGLISQLRDPILKAMAAQKEFEAQDEKEEEEEAKEEQARREKELKDEEARRKEEIGRLEQAAAG